MIGFSIIIPTLDEASGISDALERLQPLRTARHEVIIVDGGSSDRTLALAAPLADRVLTAARGRASQMNAGAEAARGGWLLFLHADTRLPENADRLFQDRVSASVRQWGRFDIAIEGRHWLLPLVARLMNLRSRLTGIATGDQAIFVRREAFLAVGGFPPLALMEDVALSRALKAISRPLCLRERVVTSGRRWESRGVLRTILLMWWLRLRYFLGAAPERLARIYDAGRRPA
jgi:rSAM/selenodomain-associated transferase 2